MRVHVGLPSITSPLGPTSFAYDPTKGQLAGITTPDGQGLGYTYDGFLETGVSWSGAVQGSVSRTYNADFRVTSTSVNGANPVTYSYDNDGLLTGAGGLTITRDPANGLIAATSLGAVTDTRSFNSYGELTGYTANLNGAPALSVTYTRGDNLGRITEKVETIQGQQATYDCTYDTAGRLTQVVKTIQGQGSLTTSYAYDPNGNRLSKTDNTGTTTGTYDAQDRLLTYGTLSYTYNANGDLTAKTQNGATVGYQYDVFGNLRHVTLDDGTAIDYVIDGRNRRIGKRINGTLVQGFLYDDQLRIAAQLDGSGNVVSRFVYGTHVNVPELIIRGSTTYRILTDHLGSPRLVVNTADGSVVQRLDFDEFGIVTLDTNPGFQPFGFAGGLYDPQTKLVRFGSRDYDAQLGRWTRKDPALFAGGSWSLYSYTLGDPLNRLDVAGLRDCATYDPLYKWLGDDLNQLAGQLGIDPAYLLALAAQESGWSDAVTGGDSSQPPQHAVDLNNPFGVTGRDAKHPHGGGHNIHYPSLGDAMDAWRVSYGDGVQGAKTWEDFMKGLPQNYNVDNPDWWAELNDRYGQASWYMNNCLDKCKSAGR